MAVRTYHMDLAGHKQDLFLTSFIRHMLMHSSVGWGGSSSSTCHLSFISTGCRRIIFSVLMQQGMMGILMLLAFLRRWKMHPVVARLRQFKQTFFPLLRCYAVHLIVSYIFYTYKGDLAAPHTSHEFPTSVRYTDRSSIVLIVGTSIVGHLILSWAMDSISWARASKNSNIIRIWGTSSSCCIVRLPLKSSGGIQFWVNHRGYETSRLLTAHHSKCSQMLT